MLLEKLCEREQTEAIDPQFDVFHCSSSLWRGGGGGEALFAPSQCLRNLSPSPCEYVLSVLFSSLQLSMDLHAPLRSEMRTHVRLFFSVTPCGTFSFSTPLYLFGSTLNSFSPFCSADVASSALTVARDVTLAANSVLCCVCASVEGVDSHTAEQRQVDKAIEGPFRFTETRRDTTKWQSR